MNDNRPTEVSIERVTRALRRIRRDRLRLETVGGDTYVTLVMQASAAARVNAATHVVDALVAAGLRVDSVDPVGDLATPGAAVVVREAGG